MAKEVALRVTLLRGESDDALLEWDVSLDLVNEVTRGPLRDELPAVVSEPGLGASRACARSCST